MKQCLWLSKWEETEINSGFLEKKKKDPAPFASSFFLDIVVSFCIFFFAYAPHQPTNTCTPTLTIPVFSIFFAFTVIIINYYYLIVWFIVILLFFFPVRRPFCVDPLSETDPGNIFELSV